MEDHKAMVKTRFKLCTFNIEWETYHVTTTCQKRKAQNMVHDHCHFLQAQFTNLTNNCYIQAAMNNDLPMPMDHQELTPHWYWECHINRWPEPNAASSAPNCHPGVWCNGSQPCWCHGNCTWTRYSATVGAKSSP